MKSWKVRNNAACVCVCVGVYGGRPTVRFRRLRQAHKAVHFGRLRERRQTARFQAFSPSPPSPPNPYVFIESWREMVWWPTPTTQCGATGT